MKVSTKFICKKVTRLIGPNEIPFFEFKFVSESVTDDKTTPDNAAFLKTTEGEIVISVLDGKYFEVGKEYMLGISDNLEDAAVAGGQ